MGSSPSPGTSSKRGRNVLTELRILTSAPFGAALTVLMLNDLYLKAHYGNWLTGKLSDVAGLMVIALLVLPFARRHMTGVCVALSLAFLCWKSPLSQPLIDFINGLTPIRFGRVVDYTDLGALLILPIAARIVRGYRPDNVTLSRARRVAAYPVGILAMFAIMGTSAFPYTRAIQIAPTSAAATNTMVDTAIAALEPLGFDCTRPNPEGLWVCRHEDKDDGVLICAGETQAVLLVQGPLDGDILGTSTSRRSKRRVDELVTAVQDALEPHFTVVTDGRSFRNDEAGQSLEAHESCYRTQLLTGEAPLPTP